MGNIPALVKHEGPGPHPGTGSSQDVHGGFLHGSSSDFDKFKLGTAGAVYLSEKSGNRKTQAEFIAGGRMGGWLYEVSVDKSKVKRFDPVNDANAKAIYESVIGEMKNGDLVHYSDAHDLFPVAVKQGYNYFRVKEEGGVTSVAITDASIIKINKKTKVEKSLSAGSLAKGDFEGHPFRGNQYVVGLGSKGVYSQSKKTLIRRASREGFSTSSFSMKVLDPNEVDRSEWNALPQDEDKLKSMSEANKDYPAILAYKDGKRWKVVDGGHRVEIAKRKGMKVRAITMSKSSYEKLLSAGFDDSDMYDLAHDWLMDSPDDVYNFGKFLPAGSLAKGDFDGHPFRGNQYVDGAGGGGDTYKVHGKEFYRLKAGSNLPADLVEKIKSTEDKMVRVIFNAESGNWHVSSDNLSEVDHGNFANEALDGLTPEYTELIQARGTYDVSRNTLTMYDFRNEVEGITNDPLKMKKVRMQMMATLRRSQRMTFYLDGKKPEVEVIDFGFIAGTAKSLPAGSLAKAAPSLPPGFWEEEMRRLALILIPRLTSLVLEGMRSGTVKVGIGFNYAIYSVLAAQWAQDYTDQLLQQVRTTNESVVGEILARWIATPGRTIGDLRAALTPHFGVQRADTIAITEATRALASGEIMAFQRAGIEEIRWGTNRDELVCPYCGPIRNEVRKIGEVFGYFKWRKGAAPEPVFAPPFHPNCRCGISPVVKLRRSAWGDVPNTLIIAATLAMIRPGGWDLAKGDFDGHPFRGNQWVDGDEAGGSLPEFVYRGSEVAGNFEYSSSWDGKGVYVSVSQEAAAQWGVTKKYKVKKEPKLLNLSDWNSAGAKSLVARLSGMKSSDMGLTDYDISAGELFIQMDDRFISQLKRNGWDGARLGEDAFLIGKLSDYAEEFIEKSLSAGDLAKGDFDGHPFWGNQYVDGGDEGATLLSDIAGGAKIDDSTFPPSVVLDQGVTLYHATNNAKRVKKTGLEPRTPPEIAEELEVEPSEVKGVYLTTSEVAERYLKGRYAGNGEVVSVYIPEGTRVFMDPVDQGSVFVKSKIPARGIASKSHPAET